MASTRYIHKEYEKSSHIADYDYAKSPNLFVGATAAFADASMADDLNKLTDMVHSYYASDKASSHRIHFSHVVRMALATGFVNRGTLQLKLGKGYAITDEQLARMRRGLSMRVDKRIRHLFMDDLTAALMNAHAMRFAGLRLAA